MMSLLFLLLLQTSPLQEYGERAGKVSEDDARGHFQLGLWCQKKGLNSEAKGEFEKSVFADPDYGSPRKKLGHRKIGTTWVSPEVLKAVEGGIRFPSREETSRVRARSREHARVIDIFWNRENWAVALSRIRDLTGLYTGTLEIQIRFALLGSVPAVGGGHAGRGTIKIDIDQLVAYEKTIENFAEKVAAGGKVVVPPAKTTAIITHELTHCFQGASAPAWFLEGMATFCAGDGHFVYFFRHQKQKIVAIEEPVTRKFVYARGWGFFEYVRSKFGPAAVRRMMSGIITDGKPISEVMQEISGQDWSDLQKDESIWTRKWIRSYRQR